MNGSIPWYQSHAVWGGIIAIVAPLIGAVFHLTITDADTQAMATALAGIGAGLGGLLAVYGRLKPCSPIAGTQAAQAIQPQAKGN